MWPGSCLRYFRCIAIVLDTCPSRWGNQPNRLIDLWLFLKEWLKFSRYSDWWHSKGIFEAAEIAPTFRREFKFYWCAPFFWGGRRYLLWWSIKVPGHWLIVWWSRYVFLIILDCSEYWRGYWLPLDGQFYVFWGATVPWYGILRSCLIWT